MFPDAQAVRIWFKDWQTRTLSRQSLLQDDLLALMAVKLFSILACGAGTYWMIRLSQSPLPFETQLMASAFVSFLAMSFVPLVQPFSRFSDRIPSHWPLSSIQRALLDIPNAVFSFWSGMFLAICAAIIFASKGRQTVAGVLAALGSLLTLTGLSLSVIVLRERKLPRSAVSAGFMTVLVSLAVALGLQLSATLTTSPWMPGSLVPLSASDIWPHPWLSALLSLSYGAACIGMYCLVFRLGNWDSANPASATASRSSSWAARRTSTKGMGAALEPGIHAAFLQQMTYLLRSPRFWFLELYGPAFGLFFVIKGLGNPNGAVAIMALTACLTLSACMFLYNAFAFDGAASWQWLYLPISFHKIALGKNLATFVASAPTLLLLVGLDRAVFHASWDMTAASAIGFCAYLTLHATVGNFISFSNPRHVDLRNMWKTFTGPEAAFALLMVLFCCSSVLFGAFLAARQFSVPYSVACIPIIIPAILIYRQSLRRLDRYAIGCSEKFVNKASMEAYD